jgi:hypothetical protein
MESIRKFFSAAAAYVAMLIGTGVWGVLLVITMFSLPLNMIAIMRIRGMDWWSALIAAILIGIIPLFGQLAFVGLAFVGAYFLIEARFDWKEAVEPTPQTITFAQMTPEQFAKYQLTIPASFAKRCKQDVAEENGNGKIFARQSAFCECYAQLASELLTQEDFAFQEKTGSMSPEATDKMKAAVMNSCN